jgi:hypothetical protein
VPISLCHGAKPEVKKSRNGMRSRDEEQIGKNEEKKEEEPRSPLS